MAIHYDALINTPFGAIAISTHAGQVAMEFLTESPSSQNIQSNNLLVAKAYDQVMSYLQKPDFAFDYSAMPQGTAYQQRVWQAIADIPYGQVRTYGQLARTIGSGPRAVANACGANMMPVIIPCHRVVAQNGIGGFMQGKLNGLAVKKWLLKHEGVDISQYE